jgi:hypothetical protein
MPGASDETRRVKVLNANWTADERGGDGRFELMIVTDDDQVHVVETSPASLTAVLELAKADTVLLWDPVPGTLIAANIVGTWLAPTGIARVS